MGTGLTETHPAGESSNPGRAAAGREIEGLLREAIAGLPDQQRAVFLLREDGGIPFREISEVLGIPLGTALARMRYALRNLRESLRGVTLEESR